MNISEEILNFLSFSAKLKTQERTIKLSDNRNESVADHSWHLTMMVLIVAPQLKEKVDIVKTLKMALIHDLVEAEIGDVPHGISYTDSKAKEEKTEREKQEIERIKQLAGDNLGSELYDLWHEFEECTTSEAKFVKALDSLEANFQSILYDVSYWDDYYYPIALTKADKYCEHEEILKNLNQEITQRMREKFDKAGVILNN